MLELLDRTGSQPFPRGSQARTVPAAEPTHWVFYGLTLAGLWACQSGILCWQGTEIQLKLKKKSSLLAQWDLEEQVRGQPAFQNRSGWAHSRSRLSHS